jgi:hypothetical protein
MGHIPTPPLSDLQDNGFTIDDLNFDIDIDYRQYQEDILENTDIFSFDSCEDMPPLVWTMHR